MSIHSLSANRVTDLVRQARIDLAATHRLAVLHELEEGIDNHFTVTVPGYEDRYLISVSYTHLTLPTIYSV